MSRVWVLVLPDDTSSQVARPTIRLIRSDEIIEVCYRGATGGYPTKHEWGEVVVVQARAKDAEGAGTCPHQFVLWRVPDMAAAATAAVRLIDLLNGDQPGVVVYNGEDQEVRLVAADKLTTAALGIDKGNDAGRD